ncbi:MAG: type-F conjugative transfer system protein TraW [Chlamydiales bacterium]
MAAFLIRGLILLILISSLEAKDLGVQGHVFPIEEENLLDWLKMKTESPSQAEVETVQKKLQNHYLSSFQKPHQVEGLTEAETYRVSYFDPTLCADQDIRNHEGKLIVRKGSCINPLETIEQLDSLLFFDGNNPDHLEWARDQSRCKWVLTNGKPMKLEEQEGRQVFFDQFGLLTERFGLKHIPAKVSKEGLKIKIEEIPLKRALCID